MKEFDKNILNTDEKISLLKQRWLIIDDLESAKHHLEHIWYFRLTWYFKFFQDKETNIFKNWTTFEQVVRLYSFDRKLRLLTLNAIEKIEVSLKANMNYEMYKIHWAFWYLKEELFSLNNEKKKETFKKFIEKAKLLKENSSSIFVKEFYKKYDENFLPSWILFEELTIWEVSKLFRLLKTNFKQKIADNYLVYQLDLEIWIYLIVNIRNISAHHSRLWNTEYIAKLRKRDKNLWKYYTFFINEKWWTEVKPNYYNSTLVINYLMKHINKNFDWIDKLEELFREFNDIDISKMWFSENWKNNFI